MIESLLAFFSMILWLEIEQNQNYWSWVVITWFIDTWVVDIADIQKHIIIEDYFLFTERLGRINYAKWCAWESTPPDRNGNTCWFRSFDCGGIMKYYGWIKNILEKKDIAFLNSRTLYELWIPKDPRIAERWDFMFWQWPTWRHFAIVSSWYNQETKTITIRDAVKNSTIQDRELKVYCNSSYCNYLWSYKIYISTNGMVELAKKRWIQVNAFKIINE